MGNSLALLSIVLESLEVADVFCRGHLKGNSHTIKGHALAGQERLKALEMAVISQHNQGWKSLLYDAPAKWTQQ